MPGPAYVQPLLWLLVFVFVAALVGGAVRYFEWPIHAKFERLLIGLVALICIVVLFFWFFALLGYPLAPR